MSSGQDLYAGYLDTEEQAFNAVMASLSAMKALLAGQSREVRSWRFKVQNWKRGVTILDPEEVEHQLSEDQIRALQRRVGALNRVIEGANRLIGEEKYDQLEKSLSRIDERGGKLKVQAEGSEVYEAEISRAQGVADDNLMRLEDWLDDQKNAVSYDKFLEAQKGTIKGLDGLAKANRSNLLVEPDSGAITRLAGRLVARYRQYPQNDLETMLDTGLWQVIGKPSWTTAQGLVEDGDLSYRLQMAVAGAITKQVEIYIDGHSKNGDSHRVEAIESFGKKPKKLDLEPVPAIEEKELRPAGEGVPVELIEQLDAFLTGPYTRTEGHEDEINELVQKIGHGCPAIEQRAVSFDVAREQSGLSDALDKLDDARNLFGSQRHSSTGKRLASRLDGAWEACYAINDKHSLTNAQRRMRSTQRAMLRWWSEKWTQRGGTPDNDNTYKSWKPSGRAKALY